MAGQDWSIKIVSSGGTTSFEPDVIGGGPGQPLQAQGGDLVSWNNRTAAAHWPWPADSSYTPLPDKEAEAAGTYLSDKIAPYEPSRPAYLCGAPSSGSTTIYYVCKLHPSEHGTIVVSA
jgi:hypothetical protein